MFSWCALAQQKNKANHIVKHRDKLNIRMALVNDIDEVEFQTEDDIEYKLRTNKNSKIRWTAQYDFLALSFAVSPSFLPGNSQKDKGNTSTRDFGVNIFTNRFFGRLSARSTKGFYVKNTSDVLPNHPHPYLLFEDFTKKYLDIEMAYNTNSAFSFRAAFMYNEQQVKSAGSFIPRLKYTKLKYSLPKVNQLKERINDKYSLSLNYIHSFVFHKNYFVTTGLGVGGGLSKVLLLETNKSDIISYNALATLYSFLQIGYSSDKYFWGITNEIKSSKDINKTITTSIKDEWIMTQIYFGYRFGAPKFLERTFDGIKSIL
jgi:curved DNA-binding protein CbpA